MYEVLVEVVQRTRQHHALEHATIHMLSARFPQQNFTGFSDPFGFTIVGDVTEPDMRRAVGDALLRLQAGESKWAMHPNCGTNLLTTAAAATLAALAGASLRRTPFERFVFGLCCALPAIVAARPVGYWFQGFTTLADVADRWVAEIQPVRVLGRRGHRVLFA
jgi:hypothetical protein